MAISKIHKAFVLDRITPISAKTVVVERAFGRFLLLLRTNGRVVSSTLKPIFKPADLVELIVDNTEAFEGFDEARRRRLVQQWLLGDFVDGVNPGRGGSGETVVAGIRPLHSYAVKMLSPRLARDYGVSDFLFNVFRGRDTLVGKDGLLTSFFSAGTVPFGDMDLKIKDPTQLDVETLFLLQMLDPLSMDKPDKNKPPVDAYEPLCAGQKKLFINDVERLFVYRDAVPRRELVKYLITMTSFHLALNSLKQFRIINELVAKRKFPCQQCQTSDPSSACPFTNCSVQPTIFVDLTNGQNAICDRLAKERVNQHNAEMHRYFKSHYQLKKLDEYATAMAGSQSLENLVKFIGNTNADGFFLTRIHDLMHPDGEEEVSAELRRIHALNLPPLEKYVEMIYSEQFRTLNHLHRDLMSSLCGMNRENGFLSGGRGKRRRKYVLGNELLEVLVQLAVISFDPKQKRFRTRPLPITEFVDWLKNRYGIQINTTGSLEDSIEVAQALTENMKALKDRLRQLGFFVDLSDASNSQVIRPRFPIE